MDWYFVGADFGQSRDYTAIAVLQRVELQGSFDYAVRAHRIETALRLRLLERIPLGTAYPEVVERVVQVTTDRRLAGRCHLAVDGTGVGRPVVDLLRRARPEAILMPVTITAGQMESWEKGFYRVPKRDLILGLQILLQRGGLEIAAGLAFAQNLLEELLAVEVRISPAGNEQYAAWREGTHDDLVFALALAYWSAQKAFPGPEKGSEPQWWVNRHVDDAERTFRKWKAEEERIRNG
ncbi:MAG TPA: hypothetical protein VHW09_13245 [Bryobacteraceae bacterium]|nr:hypothetical protein [Bryobacteraceae bacterium]